MRRQAPARPAQAFSLLDGGSGSSTRLQDITMLWSLKSKLGMALCSLLAAGTLAIAGDRPVGEILKEIDAVKVPTLDRTKMRDQSYVQEYLKKRNEAATARGKLILELYRTAPDHDRIPEFLVERWEGMPAFGSRGEDLLKEIDHVLAQTSNQKLKVEGTYVKAKTQLVRSQQSRKGKADLSAVDAFLEMAPKDQRAGQLIYMAAASTADTKAKAAYEDRLLKDFPDNMFATMVKGARRQREGIGKPFDLEFTDASSGTTISMNTLKGKVVVIDFWATWCGPCVAEMPKMKALYEEFHPKGVEFIGVSLDRSKEEGGLDKLKTFVKEKEIRWPQYYQGKYWQSEFSSSWGISSIPTMFVIDQDGKLASVEARGELEKLLPELLSKKAAKVPAGGG
jgi:thiol-disulfide isomerase/thioredoxin